MKVLFVFGTRPEAIKLCPVIQHFSTHVPDVEVAVCITAQHREMLDQVLETFAVKPDYDLNLMEPGQTLCGSASRILAALEDVLGTVSPDIVLVQGDTTSTFCGALAAFYRRVCVGHVEAGLRTGNMDHPFPEEMNRLLTSRLATLHFASTQWAADNVISEGVDASRVWVTGNTVIDALEDVVDRLENGQLKGFEDRRLDSRRKLILVTAHRRENFGDGLARICDALAELARIDGIQIVYPVHPNPSVRGPVERRLGQTPNVYLLDPLEYVPFVDLMRRAFLLITDSGGIQEEAPSLGKPVLVLRERTERPEAVDAGTVKLVGTDPEKIVSETSRLLSDSSVYRGMSRVHNPYGDGRSSQRICKLVCSFFTDQAGTGNKHEYHERL
jgi:UDP-N-acetylglucosamine 2-epimerase (non-hydrolysing)